jgi:N6-L-threonylcarbamoyladenine synthase
MLILGIETSCDETAAAVVRDGREILSSVIASQIELHRPYGGVFPELAATEHLEKIGPVVTEAMERSGVGLAEIDAIAVTYGPGLIGSLHVGVNYAKGLAWSLGKPLIGVNHIEGHVYSVVFENPPVAYPALALIVSGGHTNLFFIPEEGRYKVVSRTRDDAAGEAFDKVGKMLGLGYPGGPVIDRIAAGADASKVRFPIAKISDGRPDYSFSGLKTAVSRYIRENSVEPVAPGAKPSSEIAEIAAGFQSTVVRSLMANVEKMAAELGPRTLIVAGGVACNSALRASAEEFGRSSGIPVYFPSRHLSTDNAAMIAAAGHFHLMRGERSLFDLTADVTIRLQNIDVEDAELKRRRVRYKL